MSADLPSPSGLKPVGDGEPRRGPGRWRVAAAAAALALGLVWLSRLWVDPGPAWAGHGYRYYFPAWHRATDPSEEADARWEPIRTVEAIPFLVEVINLPDSALLDRLAQGWDMLPGSLQRHLSRPVPVAVTQETALDLLLSRLSDEEGAEAVRRHFGELPVPCRGTVLYRMLQAGVSTNHLLPLLRESLRTPDRTLRHDAVTVVFELGEPGAPLWDDTVGYLAGVESSGQAAADEWLHWTMGMVNSGIGTPATAALLDRLKPHPDFRVRIMAGFAHARISPEPRAVERWFDQKILPAGPQALDYFAHALARAPEPPTPLCWSDRGLSVWVELTGPAFAQKTLERFMTVPPGPGRERALSGRADQLRSSAIRAIGLGGTNSATAASTLAGLLSDRNRSVALAAARALERMGPVAPDTVPALVRAMTHADLHSALVPLLGGYGPLAQDALPDLEAIANGVIRPGWTNIRSYPVLTEAIARRYGLMLASPRPGTSLKDEAIAALKAVRSAGGAALRSVDEPPGAAQGGSL